MQDKESYQETSFSTLNSQPEKRSRRSFWRTLSISGAAAVVLLTVLAWGLFSYGLHNKAQTPVGSNGSHASAKDLSSGKLLCSFSDNNPAMSHPWQPSLDWSSQGQIAATYDNLKIVSSQNCASPSSNATLYSNAIWSPDGKYLLVSNAATGKDDVLNASTGATISSFPAAEGNINNGALAQQNAGMSFMSSLSGGPSGPGTVSSTVFMSVWSSNEMQIISAVTKPDPTNTNNLITSVAVWNASTGAIVRTLLTLPSGYVPQALSPNGEYVAAQKANGTNIEIWNLHSGQNVSTIDFGYSSNSALAWSPDGASLALGLPNAAQTLVWSVATGQLSATFSDVNATAHVIGTLAWSPDSKYLAESTNSIHIWDTASQKLVATFGKVEQGQWIATLAWSPKGNGLISSTNVVGKNFAQNTVNIWKLA